MHSSWVIMVTSDMHSKWGER